MWTKTELRNWTRFVAGCLVLVEEAEDVHLAEGDVQRFARVRLEAAERDRDRGLVVGLAEDHHRVVRAGTAGAEGEGVGRAGVVAEGRERCVETLALSHAEAAEQLVLDVADRLQRQFDGDVGAVVELGAGVRRVGGQTAGALDDGGQGGSRLDTFQRFDDLGRFLHFQDVLLGRFQANRKLRLVLGQARAVEALGDLSAFGLERLDFLFELGVARLQFFHAVEEFLQRGRVGRGGEGGQGQTRRDERGGQF